MTRFVYLVRHEDAYKIGMSQDPDYRLTQLVPSTADAEVLHTIESADARQVERALHQFFAGKSIGGEWFGLSAEDVALIRSIVGPCVVADLPAAIRAAYVRPAKQPQRPGRALMCYIDPEILAALDDYLAAQEPRVSKAAAVRVALRDFLAANSGRPAEA